MIQKNKSQQEINKTHHIFKTSRLGPARPMTLTASPHRAAISVGRSVDLTGRPMCLPALKGARTYALACNILVLMLYPVFRLFYRSTRYSHPLLLYQHNFCSIKRPGPMVSVSTGVWTTTTPSTPYLMPQYQLL